MHDPTPQYTSSFPEAVLRKWSAGLNSTSKAKQWQTFEQMNGLTDFNILPIIGQFLESPAGDDVLKTKFLQRIRQICPWPLFLKVRKNDVVIEVKTTDVPIEAVEWPDHLTAPLNHLEEVAYADPVLIQMAEELWVFFLEKYYPVFPEQAFGAEWTAALHGYTYNMLYPDQADFVCEHLQQVYHLDVDSLQRVLHTFQELLQAG